MTEPAQLPPAARNGSHVKRKPPAPQEAPAAFPVITAAGAAFCVGLIWFALQMRAGEDPAIGTGPQTEQPRPVVVKRIIERRIVSGPGPASSGSAVGSGGGSAGASAAASPAPAAAAPAPAAPAPAPPVSSGS